MHMKDMNLHIVCLDTYSLDVSYTCAKFVALVILCCHAFAILKQKNVPRISKKYILKRWAKEARKRVYAYDKGTLATKRQMRLKLCFTILL